MPTKQQLIESAITKIVRRMLNEESNVLSINNKTNDMTTQEIIEIAEATANQMQETVTVALWKEQRLYVNRPNQSKKYQDVGYIRLSDMQIFPAFGIKARTERDRDAVVILEKIAEAIKSGVVPTPEPKEFKSILPW